MGQSMGFIAYILDVFLHVDKHLNIVIQNFGNWLYLLLFLTVFAETGLVVTPFLPGDSLLFAAGAFAAAGALKFAGVFLVLAAAAIVGDSVNYAVGKILGERIVHSSNHRFFKKEYLERTHRFYEKYGGKTIVLARFVPVVRTFAPFVAGLGNMSYLYFFVYNVSGALLWVSIFVGGGYYFGNAAVVKENFSLVIYAIVFISVLPGLIELWRHKRIRKPGT